MLETQDTLLLIPWEIWSFLCLPPEHSQWLPFLPISVNEWYLGEVQLWISLISELAKKKHVAAVKGLCFFRRLVLQVSCLHLPYGLLRMSRGWWNCASTTKPSCFPSLSDDLKCLLSGLPPMLYIASAQFNPFPPQPPQYGNPDDGELGSHRWKISCLDFWKRKY